MTFQEAYEKALERIPRDFRRVKNSDDVFRIDINEEARMQYAHDLMLYDDAEMEQEDFYNKMNEYE